MSALIGMACIAPGAAAEPPAPSGLTVFGGEGWHAVNSFSLTWSQPPATVPALVVARYRVRDTDGTVLSEDVHPGVDDGVGGLVVPRVPGVYRAEVWFEDATGGQGPPASVPLRFDDAPPGAVTPAAPVEWIGRTAFPLRIRLGHPAGPMPLAGIRGYAAAIDADPCGGRDRCSDSETNLHGGIENDELAIASLPEGTHYLHVVAVSGAGVASVRDGQATLHVDTTDPVTELSGARPGWTNESVQLTADARDSGAGMSPNGGTPPPFTAIRVEDNPPTIAPGDEARASVIAEGSHRISFYARDAAGNLNDGANDNGIANHSPRVAWVRIDRTPPSVAFFNSQDPADPDLIRAKVADPLSGPDLARGWIGVRKAGSGERFEPLPSLPAGNGELRARWQSDAQPVGAYEFEAVAYDTAGNSVMTKHRASGAPMVLTNPLKATTTLRDGFSGGGLARVVPYGRGIRLQGRLITGLSSGLAAMPLRVLERFDAGARPSVRVSTVKTGPGGAFSIRLAPGPSRTIELDFNGSPTLARSSGQPLKLAVRSGVRLRASASWAKVGGRPLVFRGRVVAPAGAIPTEGVAVQLQFRLGHSPWAEFRTVQTDAHGRFRYAYRFSDDDSRGVGFQFRAYVPTHESWPYEPGGSRPVLVEGR